MRAHAPLRTATLPPGPAWGRHGPALLCAAVACLGWWVPGPSHAAAAFLLSLGGVLLAARVAGAQAGWLATVLGALTSVAALPGRVEAAPPSAALGEILLFCCVAGLAASLVGRSSGLGLPTSLRLRASQEDEGLEALLLRGLGEALLATDPQGVVRFINPAAARLLECTEEEAVGAPLSQLLGSRVDTGGAAPSPFCPPHGSAPGVWLEQPRVLTRRDGGELFVEQRTAPLQGAHGAARGSIVMLRDASVRRQLEEERAQLLARERAALSEAQAQRERLESLVLQAPVAIAVFQGPDHVCALLNPHARALLEIDGDALGRPLRELQSSLAPGMLRLLDVVFRGGIPFSGREVPFGSAASSPVPPFSASQRFHDLTWQPWRDARGTIQGVMAVAVEVTGLVCARRAAEDLAKDLREAVQLRDEFLSIASHELKSPITSVQLQLQFLQRAATPPGSDSRAALIHRRVNATLRSVAQLHQLVSALLDVSRIRAGRLDMTHEPVDLPALAHELVDRAREDAEGVPCHVRVDAEGPLVGHWDRMRLEQVITNLLSNAFKYGGRRPVEVRITREEGFARLCVKDQGIGIAPEDQARIFQRFERAVSARHYGGFGLGLWIVRQIVEALRGDIRVESQPGVGSTFIVRLPLQPSA
ncbi:ATP-binding protein [Myxococcus stipitatus]|uniref:sensor histidine kinase n=1 Tax=Myxococcus stipitatus TaxID=83455 RepID=UPI001F273E03|nr:HAMP domain-containing sensor histidine kinase [Myxococcus stipitatus]MCE9671887.1 ATP-binding protein [Myxococcus stipitatus]